MAFCRNPWLIIITTLYISCHGSIQSQLDQLGYQYAFDAEGDFRVEVPISKQRLVTVGVGFRNIEATSEVDVFEIWSVASRLPGGYPPGLAEKLMQDSWSSRKMGAWASAGRTSENREVLVYLIRIPSQQNIEVLKAALWDAANSAAELGDALILLEGS